MARFVHVSAEFEAWLKKAIEFARENKNPLISGSTSAVVSYLLNNGIPHDTKESKDKIPAGHHYYGE
jgi:hypothetical protein